MVSMLETEIIDSNPVQCPCVKISWFAATRELTFFFTKPGRTLLVIIITLVPDGTKTGGLWGEKAGLEFSITFIDCQYLV